VGAGLPDILRAILARKREEVSERATTVPITELAERARAAPAPRGWAAALAERIAIGRPAVIAEIKRASPSKGLLREPFEPGAIARDYQRAGAAALSVLTDRDHFRGSDEHLREARAACALPVLRKDFVVDPYQVYEARALGADCILLIAAALDDRALADLAGLARELGMDVLAEVHDRAELARVRDLEGVVLGINNRDLRTFETRIETTLELLAEVPAGRLVVSESGIASRLEVERLRAAGVEAFLVGEAFMRAPSPGEALAALFG